MFTGFTTSVLQAPDVNKSVRVQVCVQTWGRGHTICQVDEDGEHLIVYCSRKLLPRELSLATIEKECLGCVWAVQHLRPYLLGCKFVLEVDHNPLVWLNS